MVVTKLHCHSVYSIINGIIIVIIIIIIAYCPTSNRHNRYNTGVYTEYVRFVATTL